MANTEVDAAAAVSAVGPRLRALRHKRDVTLTELSATTGISTSTLSRLESGQRKPTLELLLLLARAHRVSLDELVGPDATADPRVRATAITRHGRTYLPLTQRADGLQAYKVIIPPAKPGDDFTPRAHEGYEWVYVLSGTLRLILGEHDLRIGVGEAAEFDTRVPHALGNAGAHPVEMLSLFGAQGERMHVRANTTENGTRRPE